MKIVKQDREAFLEKSKKGQGRGERARRQDGISRRVVSLVKAKPKRWFDVTDEYRSRNDARASIIQHLGTHYSPFNVRVRNGRTYLRYRGDE